MNTTVSDSIRNAIKNDARSMCAIAKDSGVHVSNLSRFVSGERGLSLVAVDKICVALNMTMKRSER
jgi:hypothetical protein